MSVTDETDLDEVRRTERYLLYVACIRIDDQQMVTGTDPASEFPDHLKG